MSTNLGFVKFVSIMGELFEQHLVRAEEMAADGGA